MLLKAGGEEDNRGWDGWMASPMWWTWVRVGSGSWWWTGKPDVLQSMGSQRVGNDWAIELNWGLCMHAKSLHLCPTVCSPMDYSPPGFSVHGILQAWILEWVACHTPPRGSFWPKDQTCISCLLRWQVGSLPLAPPGKPIYLSLPKVK